MLQAVTVFSERTAVAYLCKFMSQESISSSQEARLLGSPSPQELTQEIRESEIANQKLLDFSQQPKTLILPEDRNMAFQEASTQTEESHSSSGWTQEQLSLLREHIFYHNSFADVLNRMVNEGPSASNKLPAFFQPPKRKLASLYGEQAKKRKSMTPEELHKYLQTKEVDVSLQVRKEVFVFGAEDITSSTAAIIKLKDGYKQLQRQEATTMCFNLQYGWLLEKAFRFFEQEKESGTHKDNWDEWLKSNVGMSPSYSRKLREIARLLTPYAKRFSTVGLPFIEVYSMRKDLNVMFSSSEEIRKYWSNHVQEPMLLEQRSSQDLQQ